MPPQRLLCLPQSVVSDSLRFSKKVTKSSVSGAVSRQTLTNLLHDHKCTYTPVFTQIKVQQQQKQLQM